MTKKVIAVHSVTHGLMFCTATESWTAKNFISHLANPHEDRYDIREIWELDYPDPHMVNILIEKDKDGTAYTEFDYLWNDEERISGWVVY